jgi:hypothetical protein
VTHTYIKAIKQPTLHYLTRSVCRMGGYVLTDLDEKTRDPRCTEAALFSGRTDTCIPAVYLTWAIAVFLAFFPFSRINNFWRLNVVAGSIPTRASSVFHWNYIS